jgi:plasmid maintenance system antidote protein VapI
MTQRQLAGHLRCDLKVINRIINGATFRTSPEFWLNAQKAVDLHRAAHHLSSLPKPLLRAG